MERRIRIKAVAAAAVLILGMLSTARATIVELDLFSLGCPTEYDFNSPYWTSDFDLGVEFVGIDSVYMDWSGEITGGLGEYDSHPGEPFPLDVAVKAYLDMPIDAGTSVWGGGDTYPAPEIFDCQSDFELFGLGTWSDLLDGRATIWLYHESLIIIDGSYVEYGSIILDRANLVVEGVIPEPSTLCLLVLGGLWITCKSRRNRFN